MLQRGSYGERSSAIIDGGLVYDEYINFVNSLILLN